MYTLTSFAHSLSVFLSLFLSLCLSLSLSLSSLSLHLCCMYIHTCPLVALSGEKVHNMCVCDNTNFVRDGGCVSPAFGEFYRCKHT